MDESETQVNSIRTDASQSTKGNNVSPLARIDYDDQQDRRRSNEVNSDKGRSIKSWLAEIKELVKVLLISLAIVLPVRYFIVQPFIVRGASMEPNFYDRDYLVVDELSYAFREPKRGEVVVFRYPQDPRQFFIKRVIGLPGEQVEIKSGQVKIINSSHPQGFVLKEPYLNNLGLGVGLEVVSVLGSQEYFVLGDNRGASSDSRFWGALGRKFLIGRAIFRAWPLNQFGVISNFGFDY